MKFTPTPVQGAFVINVNRIGDDRGYSGRLSCEREMNEQGFVSLIKQSNVGFSPQAGSLKGLHYQTTPYEEVKIMRCTRDRVYDVVLDIRRDSPTIRGWCGLELNPENCSMLHVPEGCATGYLTLIDDSEIYYNTSESYAPDAATCVRYDDPFFNIDCPDKIKVVSANDTNRPNFKA